MLNKTQLKQHISDLMKLPKYQNYSAEQINKMIDNGQITVTEEELANISILYTPQNICLDSLQIKNSQLTKPRSNNASLKTTDNTTSILAVAGTILGIGLAIGFKKFSFGINNLKKAKKAISGENFAKLDMKAMQSEIEIQSKVLTKNQKTTVNNYIEVFKKRGELNKYSYTALNKILANKGLYKNEYFLTHFTDVKSPEQLDMFNFLSEKYLQDKVGFDIFQTIISSTKTEKDLIIKKSLIEHALKSEELSKSSFLTRIVSNSQSIEEGKQAFAFVKKYGILPETKNLWESQYGEKCASQMLKDIAEVKNKYVFKIENPHLQQSIGESDSIINMASENGYYLKFDKATGKLLSLRDERMLINFENHTIVNSINSVTKASKEYCPGMVPTKLLSGETVRSTENGVPLSHIGFKKSKIKGEYELYEIDSNGKVYKTGIAEFDKKGGKHVEKSITSNNGIKTDFVYADDKKGNHFLYKKITNKDGKVLFETKKSFKAISKKHFVSTNNGQSYDILYTKDKVIITKLDKNGNKTPQIVEYKIRDYTQEDYSKLEDFFSKLLLNNRNENQLMRYGDEAIKAGIVEAYTIDRKLLSNNGLMALSGEEWFALKNSGTKCIIGQLDKDNGRSSNGIIQISLDIKNRLSTILHEIGHEKYAALNLAEDPILKKIYEAEKRYCITNNPQIEIEQIAYFLERGALALNETAAESNIVANSIKQWGSTGTRTMFLERFFPETIAYIENKMTALYT